MATAGLAASIIVPTYQEAANIPTLVLRTFIALRDAGLNAELIVVDDDSQDGTIELIESLQATYSVRLIVRRGERGLSGAVLAGFREARADRMVVMDADLQHPPEMIPELLVRLADEGCEFVLGSRYVSGGEVGDQWPVLRRLGSRWAALLARGLVNVRDPLSGFFALRREVWERAKDLSPIGYKIALELMVKGHCRRVAEVPIRFAPRAAGTSKLGFSETVRYLRHLRRLYSYRYPWINAAGVLALIVAVAAVAVLVKSFGWPRKD